MRFATRGAVPQNERKLRFGELDILRALACGAVVAWHILVHVAAKAPPDTRSGWYAASQLFVLGGPVFFFLSALLCFHRHPEGERLGTFWPRRVLLLGIPYAVWTLVYLLLELRASHELSPVQKVQMAGLSLVFGVKHLAFLNALFQFYLFFPLLRWVWNRADRLPLTLAGLILGGAWLEGAPRFLPQDLPPSVYSAHAGFLPAWIPYVVLGAWASEHGDRLHKLAPRPAGLWALALLFLSGSAALLFGRGLEQSAAPLYAGAARWPVTLLTLAWLPFLLRYAWRARDGVLGSLSREFARLTPATFFAHLLPLGLTAMLAPAGWSPWALLALYALATALGTTLLLRIFQRSPAAMLVIGLPEKPRRPLAFEEQNPATEMPLKMASGQ